MPCFHPNYLEVDFSHPIKDNDKKRYNFRGRYPGGIDNFFVDGNENFVLVGCKHCIGCKLTYSRSWADRMLLELDHSKTAVFLTLTYAEHSVPLSHGIDGSIHGTLVKDDIVKFVKRLRRNFDDKEIRVFYAGEYGSKRGRPHYHVIAFGLSMDDFPDSYVFDVNELGQPSFRSDVLESIWSRDALHSAGYWKGICTVSGCSYKTFAYVARYCMKKVYRSDGSEAVYDDLGRIPEFNGMSRNPGIGCYFLREHGFNATSFAMFDGQESKSVIIPSKLFELDSLNCPELYDKIKEERKNISLSQLRGILQSTDLSYIDYLRKQELNTMDRIKVLKRGDY